MVDHARLNLRKLDSKSKVTKNKLYTHLSSIPNSASDTQKPKHKNLQKEDQKFLKKFIHRNFFLQSFMTPQKIEESFNSSKSITKNKFSCQSALRSKCEVQKKIKKKSCLLTNNRVQYKE